jgi:phage baseplate assembly protein W
MVIELTPRASLDRFKDLDLNFTAHPMTGDITPLTGEDAIKRSVKNLVLLNFYEVPFNPQIGSDVHSELFENITPFTAANIKNAINDVINKFEPRVSIIDTFVDIDADRHAVNVKIEFRIVNNPAPVTVEFVLERNN